MSETRERTLSAGQQQLFESLAQSHQAAFERLSRRLAGTAEDAEDLLQETLVDAYRGFHTFRPETRFYTWVARIMTNNQLDRVRRKRHPVVSLDQVAEEGGGETLDLPDESTNPERLLLRDQLDHPYHTALESLQPAHRATVMLCDLEGVTYEEAAQEENCPVGTIRSRLHRAHKAIRGFLSRIAAEAEPEPPSPRLHSRRAFLQFSTAAAAGAALGQFGAEEATAAAAPLRVLVWSEGTPTDVYPQDVNEAIAAGLRGESGLQVRTASFRDGDFGLSDVALAETDVLIWYGHTRQDEVSPDRLRAVAQRVREGMGLVALHDAHRGDPLRALLQMEGSPTPAQVSGEPIEIAVAAPRHPIARGLSRFRIPQSEVAPALDVPRPEVVVFDGTPPAGERVWQGLTWTRGRGRIFFFQPGHPAYPIYFQDEVRQVLRNAVKWCGGRAEA